MSIRRRRSAGDPARAMARPGRAPAILLAALVGLLALAPAAEATQFQRPFVEEFGAAEKPSFGRPLSMTVNQQTGEVLVGDQGIDERQELTVDATAGTYKLSLEGTATEDIPFGADSGEVRSALNAAFGSGITAFGSNPFQIDFSGQYGERDIEQLTCENGATPLSGGSGCSVSTVTEGKARGLYRYNEDGTPADYAALGSNRIDGKAGPGGKPCAEEPASCDQTPEDGIDFSEAGVTWNAQIAVDPTNGNILLLQDLAGAGTKLNLIDIFSPEGRYLGQLTASGSTKLSGACGVTVDATGAVYTTGSVPNRIIKYVPTGNPPVNSDFVANFKMPSESMCRMAAGTGPSAGWLFVNNNGVGGKGPLTDKVNTETGEVLEYAKGFDRGVVVDPTNGNPLAKIDNEGGDQNELGELDGSLASTEAVLSRVIAEEASRIDDFATDGAGRVYVIASAIRGRPSLGEAEIRVYGATPGVVPTVTVGPADEVTSSSARLSGTVNPDGTNVEECFFEWGEFIFDQKAPCDEVVPTDSNPHEVHATITGLKPNGGRYRFRLAAKNATGTEHSSVESLTTASTVQTEAATVTGIGSATLNGALRPEGSQYTECFFEWGLTSRFGYEHTTPCTPEAGEIPPDTAVHTVRAALTGLREAASYRFRVQATNGEGTLIGAERTFETWGPPQITALRARDASRSAATLEAEIDPSGFETSYWFEWGPTSGWGHRAPIVPKSIGGGEQPVRVQAQLSGLNAGTAYHFRVVAASANSTNASDDQIVETLNSCGLPEGRCFELVSRRDVGPIAIPGENGPPIDLHSQAATVGPGLVYPVESGYPDATKGHVVVYRGSRGAGGWSSTQVSTPVAGKPEVPGIGSISGTTQWLSDDLACGVGVSTFALTNDPGPRLLYEAGKSSLYRLDADGGYTAVPPFPPEELAAAYETAGASQDCRKVVFENNARYHGIPDSGLYEWEEGSLRSVGFVPGPGGEEVVVPATAAGFNAVSPDGRRVFFTAARQASPNAAEIGAQGVFVREDGATTRDLSLSKTSTPNLGARFRYATPDGSKVFFMANAGLTAESSPKGTDLYEYDLETDTLTDLSVLDAPDGAGVTGFVGASDDGSHVYFTARGQFVPGHGKTFAENQQDDTQSLYGVHNGEVNFVAPIEERSGANEFTNIVSPGEAGWSSRVSRDGRYLLFQTRGDVTGYDSGGATEAYLYDSSRGSEGTICISCRPDGQSSFEANPSLTPVLADRSNNPLNPVQFLTEGVNGPRVFFSSLDALAPGAVEGQNNVYEWSHGQVFRLASSPPGQQTNPISGQFTGFLGAAADGSNVYFSTPETLNWEDGDERTSIYDARIGGGLPQPPAPPAPCDPGSEGSCRGPSQSGPASPTPATTTFSGPGNEKPAKAGKRRKHKKHTKHRRHRKRGKQGKGKRHGKSKQGKPKTRGKNRKQGKGRKQGKHKQQREKAKQKRAGADRRAGK